jgi:gamma-glutamylcyclotransferase (GGCT)/AIG2-like uncharacterized protein YtfP
MNLVFAFGMNLDPSTMRGCDEIGPAVLRGWALEFREFANITPEKGEKVPGALWSCDDRRLQQLDQREGFYSPGNTRNLYDRLVVKVDNGDEQVEAIVYTMAPHRLMALYPPSVHYLAWILAGYSHFGLDTGKLWAAVRKACPSAERFRVLHETATHVKEAETHA